MNKPRVLLIAEAANPEWVSVPLVGWSLASALRSVADVHLVTQIRNRDAISRAGYVEGKDFTAIDSEAFAKPLWALGSMLRMGEGKGWTTLQLTNALSYPWFEHLVWREFGPAICAGEYDIVHRITPLSPTISSPIARKCKTAGIPFVVGPLNGGLPWPKAFDGERRKEKEWLSYVRNAYKALPGRNKMLEASSAIIIGSAHTASEIPAKYRERCAYIPENAINSAIFSRGREKANDRVLRACFIGRMVPYKGPDLLLEAAAPLISDGRMRLDMIGDGPMIESLRAQVRSYGCEAGVSFHGWLDQERVRDVAAESSLFAFPAIREFGGGAVLEAMAMAMGLVPLIVDYGGPSELVTPNTGFKVKLGNRASIIADFRSQLERITENVGGLRALAQNAQERAHSLFTWPHKAEQVGEIYDWVLRRRSDRPDPFAFYSANLDKNDLINSANQKTVLNDG